MLNRKNIRAKQQCIKLVDKMYGPFEVINTGRNGRYCKLKLPDSWKIHPTSNIALLENYQGTNPKKQVVKIEADNTGCKMEAIIPSGSSDDNPRKYVYLVKWEGYSHDENMWETYENILECSSDLLKDYYGQNPTIERDRRFERKKH